MIPPQCVYFTNEAYQRMIISCTYDNVICEEKKYWNNFLFGMAINNIIYARGGGVGGINDSILNIDNKETRMIKIIIIVALVIEKENGWWLKLDGIKGMKEKNVVKQLSSFTPYKNYFWNKQKNFFFKIAFPFSFSSLSVSLSYLIINLRSFLCVQHITIICFSFRCQSSMWRILLCVSIRMKYPVCLCTVNQRYL